MSLLIRHRLVHAPRVAAPPPPVPGRPVAATGAPILFHSGDEVNAYALRMDVAINALYQDMRAKTVHTPPSAYRATADKMPDTFANASIKAALYAEAKKMEAREVGRSPDQIARELAFGRDYHVFYKDWRDWYVAHQSGWTLYASMWDTIEVYDSQYRQYYARFRDDVKIKPSAPLPPSNPEIDAEHPGTLTTATKNALGTIPWTIALVVVGGLVLYALVSKSSGGGASVPRALPEHEPEAA